MDVDENHLQKKLKSLVKRMFKVFLVFSVTGVLTTMAMTRPTITSSLVIEIYQKLDDIKQDILENISDEVVVNVNNLPDRESFLMEVMNISAELGIDASLMIIKFHYESRVNPNITNKDTGASGIFQLMNSTLETMKEQGRVEKSMTLAKFRRMSATEQLRIYKAYIAPYAPYIKTVEDLYIANIWPKALKQKGDAVLFKKGSIYYDQNKVLDYNNNGKVTKSDIRKIIVSYLKDTSKYK